MSGLNNDDDWQDPEYPLPLSSPMSYHENSSKISVPSINNLYQLFKSSEYNDCISNQQSEALCQIIHANPILYHQILDIMLCLPNEELSNHLKQHYSEKEIQNLPYKCFELLNSMNEEQAKYLLTVESKTEAEIENVNNILKHLFSVFEQNEINETSAGYVLRFNESILMRQSSFPLYEWLNSHEDVLGNILQHFDSYSAVGIIVRLLDLQVQSVSIEQRTRMIETMLEKVADLTILLDRPKLLQGLKLLIDQQFQRAMNSQNAETLTNQIITRFNINKLVEIFQSSHESATYLLQIVVSILNHYKKEQPKPEKQNHHSRNYMGYRPPPQINIDDDILQSLIKILSKIYDNFKQQEDKNFTNSIKIYYFRYIQVLGYLGKYYTQSVKEIVNVGLINDILYFMTKYQKNSLLHIGVKDFLIGVIKGENKEVIYHKDCNLIDFVFKGLVEAKNLFQQHLFQIMRQLQEDKQLQSKANELSQIQFQKVCNVYQGFLNKLPSPEAENENEDHGQESQIEDLADFDPTKNIDNLSPYYYQEMIIDDDYEKQGQRRGSYGWKDGKIVGGVLSRNIVVDVEEVQSPVIYRFGEEGQSERDKERMWGLKMPHLNSLLDSQNQDNIICRKLSNKFKQVESFQQRQQKSKLQMSDQQRQQSMNSQVKQTDKIKQQQSQNVPIQSTSKIGQTKQQLILKQIKEQQAASSQSYQTNSGFVTRVARTIFSPLIWVGKFIWQIS